MEMGQTPMSATPEAAVSLTFDIDWAPDWCVALCARMCAETGAPATFFATHASPALDNLLRDPLFEVGIHPNFLAGSSHGVTPREVLDHCLALVPDASAMRTHGLFQSSELFALICDHYPPIETDVSLLLPFHRNLAPTELYMGASRRRLTRLPYCWEDDVAASWPGWRWDSEPTTSPGMTIFAFHPIHVALNTRVLAPYADLKRRLGSKPLQSASEAEVAPYVEPGHGTMRYLKRILSSVDRARLHTVSAITRLGRAGSASATP